MHPRHNGTDHNDSDLLLCHYLQVLTVVFLFFQFFHCWFTNTCNYYNGSVCRVINTSWNYFKVFNDMQSKNIAEKSNTFFSTQVSRVHAKSQIENPRENISRRCVKNGWVKKYPYTLNYVSAVTVFFVILIGYLQLLNCIFAVPTVHT